MAHKPEHDEILNNLTQKEKEYNTSPDGLAQDGLLIKQFEHRYLAWNKYPHTDRGNIQLVLWLNGGGKNRLGKQKTTENYPKKHARIEKEIKIKPYLRKNFFKGSNNIGELVNHSRDKSIERYHVHFFN